MEVLKGLVANKHADKPQLIRVVAATSDINSNTAELTWHNIHASGSVGKAFASATLFYGDALSWLSSWVPMAHLVNSRIRDLEHLADSGVANRFTHNMAYVLFANNLVDYASKYRGMQSVVMHEFEAFADVVLSLEPNSGSWRVPPYFIDSVAHLAGFVMNVSDTSDTKNTFCITPGWRSMRFAKPLVTGAQYRSYVHMIPTAEDPTIYFGNVYVLQDGVIVGLVEGIQFRRYPRILLGRFFSAPDDSKALPVATAASSKPLAAGTPHGAARSGQEGLAASQTASSIPPTTQKEHEIAQAALGKAENQVNGVVPHTAKVNHSLDVESDSTTAKAFKILATETALEISDLTDDANFAEIGVDSLMSLVLAEKFREQLGVTIGGSLFLEYPTVGDLRRWLEEYYN